jgi:hypothetical protein
MELRYYHDFGIPEVERLARAIAIYQGQDPDRMVHETGYADAALMPLWWRYQADAMKYIAMRDADKQPSPDRERR